VVSQRELKLGDREPAPSHRAGAVLVPPGWSKGLLPLSLKISPQRRPGGTLAPCPVHTSNAPGTASVVGLWGLAPTRQARLPAPELGFEMVKISEKMRDPELALKGLNHSAFPKL